MAGLPALIFRDALADLHVAPLIFEIGDPALIEVTDEPQHA
jgi:hypothetical protein